MQQFIDRMDPNKLSHDFISNQKYISKNNKKINEKQKALFNNSNHFMNSTFVPPQSSNLKAQQINDRKPDKFQPNLINNDGKYFNISQFIKQEQDQKPVSVFGTALYDKNQISYSSKSFDYVLNVFLRLWISLCL